MASQDERQEEDDETTSKDHEVDLFDALKKWIHPPTNMMDSSGWMMPHGYVNWDDANNCNPPTLPSMNLSPPSVDSLPLRPAAGVAMGWEEASQGGGGWWYDNNVVFSVCTKIPRTEKIMDTSSFIFVEQMLDNQERPLVNQEASRYTQWGRRDLDAWPYASTRTSSDEILYAANLYKKLQTIADKNDDSKKKEDLWYWC